MEWKMHHWKYFLKLRKVTSNEHHENWTLNTPKWGMKKMKKELKKDKIVLRVRIPKIGIN